ncbi:hypothetical protein HETIRDRAFT_327084 [Heterobasidion irregulare TC 32-1]|uniref:Uncharacterized protein n=1 Tax=Heterobasidion irregulare (strain TC 32-1) TaxID=747525 RepID=W4JV46_HETIT|nr:uncharacterized protein HETIRDRAFT_327084 [Heterobasidion irregulare TC 32-1]ETW77443.1 hypothetical protein HETIRDRAFT_327084 [Heterobasidion irregulare TC 32-1]
MASLSSASMGPTASQVSGNPPPILEIFNFLSSSSFILWGIAASTFSGLYTATSYLFTPLTLLLPVVIYIVSPITLFLQLVLDGLIIVPFNLSVYILQAIYPLYVFVGVACVSGAVIGFGARHVVSVVGHGLLGRKTVKDAPASREPDDSRAPVPRSSRKGKKKVSLQ